MNARHDPSPRPPRRPSLAWSARALTLAVCAMAMACAKSSKEPSAFRGVEGDAAEPHGGDMAELAALEAQLGELRGELDRSTYLARAVGGRAFESKVEAGAVMSDEQVDEAERDARKDRAPARDRESRRTSKAKRGGGAGGGEGAAPAPSAPPSDAAELADDERVAQQRPAPSPGGDEDAAASGAAAEAPAATFADEGETCPKVCELSESICALTDRVCSLAMRHEGDARFEAACGRAKTDCTDAVAACAACTVGE